LKHLSTTDNNCGVSLDKLEASNNDYENLSKIANISLIELIKNNSSLLLFPNMLGNNNDGIEEQTIFNMYGDSSNLSKVKLHTGNLMGYIGINNTKLRISSRFSNNDNNDYFLQYLLQKVFSINLFDFKYSMSLNGELELLFFIFPFLLKKALSQGIFKTYQTFRRNDSCIKGVIDIARHIKTNVPFFGMIAYNSRERTVDNYMTQLIRHTIEYIKTKSFGKEILFYDIDTKEAVNEIIKSTNSYCLKDRNKIIFKNLKALNHPYFTFYKSLQQLCISILTHKKIGYGNSDNKVYGILFDGAWLWEEYLATILKSIGFKHPKNKTEQNGIRVYRGRICYPDFYKGSQIEDIYQNNQFENNLVMDAKYKRLENKKEDEFISRFSREDLYQLITYMHVLPAKTGGLIYPISSNNDKTEICKSIDKNIFGLGGNISTYGLPIPTKDKYPDFAIFMNKVENDLKKKLA